MTDNDIVELRRFFNNLIPKWNNKVFIEHDPISIPYKYTQKQDIEIVSFLTCIIAWGRRNSIIKSASLLCQLMDNSPHDFICNHKEKDLARFENFKHRTFSYTDLLYFITFLHYHYSTNNSLESAFLTNGKCHSIKESLISFHRYFIGLSNFPLRTKKHIANPERNSACKRLNMFLRWMVRKDKYGVDFGIWHTIKPSQLMIPLDIHVYRMSRKFKLTLRKSRDWKTVEEISSILRILNPADPCIYDFVLLGLGIDSNHQGLQ